MYENHHFTCLYWRHKKVYFFPSTAISRNSSEQSATSSCPFECIIRVEVLVELVSLKSVPRLPSADSYGVVCIFYCCHYHCYTLCQISKKSGKCSVRVLRKRNIERYFIKCKCVKQRFKVFGSRLFYWGLSWSWYIWFEKRAKWTAIIQRRICPHGLNWNKHLIRKYELIIFLCRQRLAGRQMELLIICAVVHLFHQSMFLRLLTVC